MSVSTLVARQELASLACCSCGIEFAVPQLFMDRRRADHESFYCPSGHSNYYPGKTQEEILKEQLARERVRADNAQSAREWAEKQVRAQKIQTGKAKAATKRLLHRAECGVCPHCNRTFSALARHIKSKHPERLKK